MFTRTPTSSFTTYTRYIVNPGKHYITRHSGRVNRSITTVLLSPLRDTPSRRHVHQLDPEAEEAGVDRSVQRYWI